MYKLPQTHASVGVTPQLIAFLLLAAMLALWAGTQVVAHLFHYHPALGDGIFTRQSFTLYEPWAILQWTLNAFLTGGVVNNPAMGPLMKGWAAVAAVLIPSAIIAQLIRLRKQRLDDSELHGSASWATMKDAEEAALLGDEGVYVGAMEDKHGNLRYLMHNGPEHILAFAPTRSGKGVSLVIPTLLAWKESVVVHDIKGENYAITAGWRQKQGQIVLRFAPTEEDCAKFNPLAEVRLDQNIVKDVQNIATMIVDPDGKGLQDHWAKTGFDLLTGVILYVLLSKDLAKKERNLATVQAILSDGGPIRLAAAAEANKEGDEQQEQTHDIIKGVFEYIKRQAYAALDTETDPYRRNGWETAAQASQSFLNKAPNEASGVLSTALSFLSLYRDPIVARNTSVSEWKISDLMHQDKPVSLYLVVPPSDKARLKPLIRLILNQIVRTLTEKMDFKDGRSVANYKHRLLLLIDEFPALGKLDVFEEALAFIAGYGLKAYLITQDMTQLQKHYSRDESIVSNCHIRIAYAPNKIETAKLISDILGQQTVVYEQVNYSGKAGGILDNVSVTTQMMARPLITPDEVMRLEGPVKDANGNIIKPGAMLIMVANRKPILGRQILYFRDPVLSARSKVPTPEHTDIVHEIEEDAQQEKEIKATRNRVVVKLDPEEIEEAERESIESAVEMAMAQYDGEEDAQDDEGIATDETGGLHVKTKRAAVEVTGRIDVSRDVA